MARTRIEDLPKVEKLSEPERKRLFGGALLATGFSSPTIQKLGTTSLTSTSLTTRSIGGSFDLAAHRYT